MYCQRLARAFTGKPKILKFEGAYHGANEAGVTSLFPKQAPRLPAARAHQRRHAVGRPRAAGRALQRPATHASRSSRSIARVRRRHHGAAAALHAARARLPRRRARPPATRSACLLIFDEVVTGFRLAYGGAQEYYGVVPDLVAYGKALGGGYPIGAFGGRRDIMDLVNEHRIGGDGYVWMASTLGGNPISTAAANAALSVLRRPGTYERLHAPRHIVSARRCARSCATASCVAQVIGDGPLAQVVFSDRRCTTTARPRAATSSARASMMLGLFARGVFINPMGTKLYLSIAHDEAICDAFCERFDADPRGDPVGGTMHDKVLAGTVALLLAVAGSGGAPQLAQAQSSSPAIAETAAMVAAMKPGEFRAVGKNTMKDVIPPPDKTTWAVQGPIAVMSSWGGAAFDTKRNLLLVTGGGHNDYGGNEVYHFRLDTLRWERATNPSPMKPVGNGQFEVADGSQAPISFHSYDGLVYVPPLDRMFALPQASYQSGNSYDNSAYLYDPEKRTWTRHAKPSFRIGPDFGLRLVGRRRSDRLQHGERLRDLEAGHGCMDVGRAGQSGFRQDRDRRPGAQPARSDLVAEKRPRLL